LGGFRINAVQVPDDLRDILPPEINLVVKNLPRRIKVVANEQSIKVAVEECIIERVDGLEGGKPELARFEDNIAKPFVLVKVALRSILLELNQLTLLVHELV
jgi:hypothetical protein